MKSIAAGLILAVILFAAGTVSLAESRHARRLADAQLRLATVQYTDEGDLASDATLIDRLPPPVGLDPGTESRHAATVSYWLARYTSLTDLTDADLRDIGMERRDIASVVDRELARLRRNDLSWHK